MNNHIGHTLSDGLMHWRVIYAFQTFQPERTFQIGTQFGYNTCKEVVQVILPHAIISQTITPSDIAHQICLVYIIHAQVVKAVTHRKPFAKHQ